MNLTMRSILFSCCFLLLSSAVWSLQAAEEIQNLVANPDFIDLQQNWRLIVSTGAATWEVEKRGGVGDDTECAFIQMSALPDPWWNIYLTQTDIPLEKGKEYTYCVWAKTEEGKDKDITMKVQKHADGTKYTSTPFTIDGEWKEYWVTWVQPESQADGQIIVFVGSAQRLGKDDRLWLDHFRVYEGDYEEDELSPQAVELKGKLATLWGNAKVQ